MTDTMSLEDGPGGQLSHDTAGQGLLGTTSDDPPRQAVMARPLDTPAGRLHQSPEGVFRSADYWPPISPFSQSRTVRNPVNSFTGIFFSNWNILLLYHVVLVSAEQHSE